HYWGASAPITRKTFRFKI
ncbi:hypothetical protein D039_3362B, partial [Vibrio parahaemolyticus EKP-028]